MNLYIQKLNFVWITGHSETKGESVSIQLLHKSMQQLIGITPNQKDIIDVTKPKDHFKGWVHNSCSTLSPLPQPRHQGLIYHYAQQEEKRQPFLYNYQLHNFLPSSLGIIISYKVTGVNSLRDKYIFYVQITHLFISEAGNSLITW